MTRENTHDTIVIRLNELNPTKAMMEKSNPDKPHREGTSRTESGPAVETGEVRSGVRFLNASGNQCSEPRLRCGVLSRQGRLSGFR